MSPFILYIFLLFNFTINIMVFPFKQALEHKNGDLTPDKEAYNGTNFAIDYFDTKLYTQIKIGNPYQEVKVLLAGELCAFKIGKSKNCIYSDEYLSYYNRNKSNDFTYTPKYSHEDWEFNDTIGSTAEDTLYTYTDLKLKNEIKFKNVGFYLGSDTNDKLCGIIGLQMDNVICARINNLVKVCRNKKYIRNFKFSIIYNNNNLNEGLFIIGSEFKNIINNYDDNKNFIAPLSNRVILYRFGIDFDKIIIGEKNETVDINIPSEINNDFYFIVGGPQYFKRFNSTFFDFYFKKGICKVSIYDNKPELRLSEKYNVIECQKEKFGINDLIKFPKIYMFLANYFEQKIFVFDYKDLFTETKYKYFLNMIFDNFTRTRLELGKIFLKKYPVNFNFYDNTIEIYDDNLNDNSKNTDKEREDKNSDKNKNYFILYIVIIIILVFSIGFVGYFIGKYLNKIRKKRANELIDEYDYDYNYKTDDKVVNEQSINS